MRATSPYSAIKPRKHWMRRNLIRKILTKAKSSLKRSYTRQYYWTGKKTITSDTENILVQKRRKLHDDWYNILRAIQFNVTAYCSLTPFQPHKAIMCCEGQEQAKIMDSYKGQQKVGSYQLFYSRWNQEEYFKEQVVPSYGVGSKFVAYLLTNGTRNFQFH